MIPFVIAVLFGTVRPVVADLDTVLPGSVELCEFEKLADVDCTLQPPDSCKVFSLPEYDCYSNRPDCRGDKTFVQGKDFLDSFDPEKNMTTLHIWNSKENRLLLTTMHEREAWWQVELPEGTHNISITDLPGRLVATNPIQPTKPCDGCPPPRVRFLPYQKLHVFQFLVSSVDGSPKNVDLQREVKIEIHASNVTLENCLSPDLSFTEEARGKINEVMTVQEVYGIDFCFVISVNHSTSRVERRYICRMQEDMTEPLYIIPQSRIDVPKWWIVGLALLICFLIIASLVPLAIRKGLLRLPWRRSKTPRRCKGYNICLGGTSSLVGNQNRPATHFDFQTDGEVSFLNQNSSIGIEDSKRKSHGRATICQLEDYKG